MLLKDRPSPFRTPREFAPFDELPGGKSSQGRYPMANARILRIEKTSSYDGDGLRTVVFLKGCPLRCVWCSTPESHNLFSDFGNHRQKCTHCFRCIEMCPENAISYNADDDTFITNMKSCTDCRKCMEGCLSGSRIAYGYTASVAQIMAEVEKDSLFYFHSNGGVTVSGGEPLLQIEFTKDLLKGCVNHGINTAIETCAHVPYENFDMVLPYVDTLFIDVKHMDDRIHKKITGVGNQLILENILLADGSPRNFDIIIRMPVIPMLNDDDENFMQLGNFCKRLKKLKEIQLLPYHRLGIETYKRLSIPYSLEQLGTPDNVVMENNAAILRKMNLSVRIGS